MGAGLGAGVFEQTAVIGPPERVHARTGKGGVEFSLQDRGHIRGGAGIEPDPAARSDYVLELAGGGFGFGLQRGAALRRDGWIEPTQMGGGVGGIADFEKARRGVSAQEIVIGGRARKAGEYDGI